MFKYKFALVFVVILALSPLLQACSSSQQSEGELPDIGKIQIGYIPNTASFWSFLAQEKGYFKEMGLDVEMTSFKSASDMIAPLSTGQLDIGSGEPGTAFFNASNQGLDIKIVCSSASQKLGYGATPILVRKDLAGEITKPEDLKGRKIAANVLRGMTEYIIAKYLANGGLTVDDVELVPIPFADTPPALANKAVDAAYLTYPAVGKAIADGTAEILVNSDEIAGEIQNGVLYFGKRLLDPANREIAVRLLMIYMRVIRETAGDSWKTDEVVKVVNSFTNMDPEVIKSGKLSYRDPNCELVMDSLEDVQNYYLSRGYTEYTEALPLSDVIVDDFAKEAVKRLGEFEE